MAVSAEAIANIIGGRLVQHSERITDVYPNRAGTEGGDKPYVRITQATFAVQLLTVNVYGNRGDFRGVQLINPTPVEGDLGEIKDGGMAFRDGAGEVVVFNPGGEVIIHHAPQQPSGQRAA